MTATRFSTRRHGMRQRATSPHRGHRIGRRGFRVFGVVAGLTLLSPIAASPSVSYAAPCCNTSYGSGALAGITTGDENSAFGYQALVHDDAGNDNSAVGFQALFSNKGGIDNTAAGELALSGNTTGGLNTADGFSALYTNVD